MIIRNILNYKYKLNFQFLVFLYILALCWPLKFGTIKIYEIISIFIIFVVLNKNLLKSSIYIFIAFFLLISIIFLSWAVNLSTPLLFDPNIGAQCESS